MNDEAQRIADLREALEFSRYVGICNAIEALRTTMPPELAKEVLDRAADTFDQWDRSQILLALARHLPDALFTEALELAARQNDPDIGNRDHVLVALASRFSDGYHPLILDVARRTEGPDERVVALTRLLPLMPSILPEAVATANLPAVHAATRAWAFAKFVLQDVSLAAEALAVIAANPVETERASMLTAVLGSLDDQHIPAVSAILATVPTATFREPLLKALKARFPDVIWFP